MLEASGHDRPANHDAVLNGLVRRVNRLVGDAKHQAPAESNGYIPIAEAPPTYGDFVPQEPATLQETRLSSSEVESLILKLLLSRGDLTGREVTEHIKLPFVMVERVLREMKHDQLVAYRNAAPMNDYVHQLTEIGRERAKRLSMDELSNRWIVPLEKRYDFLNLANGKKIQVPFDQLIVFSTNREPRDVVDEAFLRRIPYKIEVGDPSEAEFRQLFEIVCKTLNVPYRQEPIDYLIEKHYRPVGRPFRCCQPRDLVMQICNHCFYQGIRVELTNEHFDFAVETYFTVL